MSKQSKVTPDLQAPIEEYTTATSVDLTKSDSWKVISLAFGAAGVSASPGGCTRGRLFDADDMPQTRH
jgi:hypothetical protein